MPDGKNYELVDGHLVERNMSQLSSWVGGQLHFQLNAFLRANPIGWAWPADLGYECYPDAPNKVRKPDVSFIRIERKPDGPTSEGYARIPPDLAAEVISPNDLWQEVEAKVQEYLAAGVRLIWVIDPEGRVVYVIATDGTVSRLRRDRMISPARASSRVSQCPVSSSLSTARKPQTQEP